MCITDGPHTRHSDTHLPRAADSVVKGRLVALAAKLQPGGEIPSRTSPLGQPASIISSSVDILRKKAGKDRDISNFPLFTFHVHSVDIKIEEQAMEEKKVVCITCKEKRRKVSCFEWWRK